MTLTTRGQCLTLNNSLDFNLNGMQPYSIALYIVLLQMIWCLHII